MAVECLSHVLRLVGDMEYVEFWLAKLELYIKHDNRKQEGTPFADAFAVSKLQSRCNLIQKKKRNSRHFSTVAYPHLAFVESRGLHVPQPFSQSPVSYL